MGVTEIKYDNTIKHIHYKVGGRLRYWIIETPTWEEQSKWNYQVLLNPTASEFQLIKTATELIVEAPAVKQAAKYQVKTKDYRGAHIKEIDEEPQRNTQLEPLRELFDINNVKCALDSISDNHSSDNEGVDAIIYGELASELQALQGSWEEIDSDN